jgi:hypothetical protein
MGKPDICSSGFFGKMKKNEIYNKLQVILQKLCFSS